MALQPMHNEAIRTEIAERLKTFLDREPAQMSANLDRLLRQYRGWSDQDLYCH